MPATKKVSDICLFLDIEGETRAGVILVPNTRKCMLTQVYPTNVFLRTRRGNIPNDRYITMTENQTSDAKRPVEKEKEERRGGSNLH
jgi:hypothetical protein